MYESPLFFDQAKGGVSWGYENKIYPGRVDSLWRRS